MINTKELEKRWYRYKTKGFLAILAILAILTTLIYGGYYILYKLDLNVDHIKESSRPKAVIAEKITEDINTSTTNNMDMEINRSGVMLAPSIPIVDLEREKLKDKKSTSTRVARTQKTRHQRVQSSKKIVEAKKSTYLTAKELSVVSGKTSIKRETKKIDLKGSHSNYMGIMKKKFNSNKNPREAVLISKAYYNAGNYKKSEEWALIANNLDKKLDESWLLFAKSKYQLGKRKEALKILVAYYRKSKSVKAKSLIEKMRTKRV